LAKAVAGLTAQAKGRLLGIYKPHEDGAKKTRETERGEEFWVEICGKPVPARNTDDGIRAVHGNTAIDPDSVRRYLESKFGDNLGAARSALERLAEAYKPQELAEVAYQLYERFRPDIPAGTKGWGAKGELDLGLVEALAKKRK
jgi:hypothetical protein